MKKNLSIFIIGFIFALGLGISGMALPEKVIHFLDLFGDWDPSLAFVMGGALLIHAPAYYLIRRRREPVMTREWKIPTRNDLTLPLVVGGALFGVGWGLAGYCPAPVITALPSLQIAPAVFVGSMILGMGLFKLFEKAKLGDGWSKWKP